MERSGWRPLPPDWPVKGVMVPPEPIFDGRRARIARQPPAEDEALQRDRSPRTRREPSPAPFRLALGVQEAARIVGVSHSAISREIAAGRLKAKRYGRRVLILPRDLREWLKSLPDA